MFMSGYTESTLVDYDFVDDNTVYVQKPFSRQSLIRDVRKLLQESREE